MGHIAASMLAGLEADSIQILALERSLSALRIKKALAKERLNSYKYPVLTLPNEIISEIFIHLLPPCPLCPPITAIFSPTHLTHICRRWLEIALGTPELWRVISIFGNDIPFGRQLHTFDI
jgi:hypothetical protein